MHNKEIVDNVNYLDYPCLKKMKNVYERIRNRVKPETKEKVKCDMNRLMRKAKVKKAIWVSILFLICLAALYFTFNWLFSDVIFITKEIAFGYKAFAIVYILLNLAGLGGIIAKIFHEKFQ